MASSLARSLASNWVGQLTGILVGLFVPSLVIRTLGQETYGVWALLVSIVAQLSLLDFGSRHAIVRLSAQYHGEGRDGEIPPLLQEVVRIVSCSALVGIISISLVAFWMTDLFTIPEREVVTAQLLLLLLAVDAACDLVSGPYSSALGGIERYDLLQLGNTGRLLLNAALVALFLSCGWGLTGVAAALVLSRLAYRSYVVGVVRRLLSFSKIACNKGGVSIPRGETRSIAKSVFSYGLLTTVMILGGKICYQCDVIVIGSMLTATAVTAYAIPLIIIDQLRAIIESAHLVLFSRLSKISRDQWEVQAFPLLDRWGRYSLILLLSVGVHLAVFGGDFIELWIGTMNPESVTVLRILLLALLVSAPLMGYNAALLARSRPGLLASVVIIEAVVNLSLSLILIQNYGIVGVALGTFLATTLVQGAGCVLVYRKVADYPHKRLIRHGVGRTMVVLPLYYLAVMGSRAVFGEGSLFAFLLGNVLPLPLLAFVLLRWVILREDRDYFYRRFSFWGRRYAQ
jgi:O-antigen/teichoic acid export membrane protein